MRDYDELLVLTIEHDNGCLHDDISLLDIVKYGDNLYTVIENNFSSLKLKPIAKYEIKGEN